MPAVAGIGLECAVMSGISGIASVFYRSLLVAVMVQAILFSSVFASERVVDECFTPALDAQPALQGPRCQEATEAAFVVASSALMNERALLPGRYANMADSSQPVRLPPQIPYPYIEDYLESGGKDAPGARSASVFSMQRQRFAELVTLGLGLKSGWSLLLSYETIDTAAGDSFAGPTSIGPIYEGPVVSAIRRF